MNLDYELWLILLLTQIISTNTACAIEPTIVLVKWQWGLSWNNSKQFASIQEDKEVLDCYPNLNIPGKTPLFHSNTVYHPKTTFVWLTYMPENTP